MADETRVVNIQYESNIDKYNQELEDTTESQQEYNKALDDTIGDMKLFGVSLNQAKSQIASVGRSLGNLKVALAATGIGAVLVLWQAFNVALGASKRLQDELRVSTAAANGVWSKFAGTLGDAFDNLLGLNEELEEGQKQLSFFEKATLSVTNALQAAGIISAETAVGYQLAATAAGDLERETIALEDSQKQFNLEIAQGRLEIELLIQATRGLNKTGEEQLRIVNQALVQFDQLTAKQRERLDNEIALAKADVEAAGTTKERFDAEQALLELQTQALEFDRQASAQRRELLNRQLEASNRIKAIQVETIEGNVRLNQEANDAIFESDLSLLDKQISLQQIIAAKNKEAADLQILLEKEKNEAIAQGAAGLAGALASLFGQQSAAGKALAISEATINTWVGATQALRSLPPPLSYIAAATTIAQGLAAVKNIVGTPIPKVQIQETPFSFAKGGMIGGRPHSAGGTVIEAERGEAIINKRSMALPGVREAASYLNELGGGIKFANGGIVPDLRSANSAVVDAINRAASASQVVLVTEDLDVVQNRVAVTEDRSTL